VLFKMFIKGNIIDHIRNFKTSNETWKVLKYSQVQIECFLFIEVNYSQLKWRKRKICVIFFRESRNLKISLVILGRRFQVFTLNGMLGEYKMFITRLATRKRALTFDELVGIILQEVKLRNNLNCSLRVQIWHLYPKRNIHTKEIHERGINEVIHRRHNTTKNIYQYNEE